MRFKKIGSSLSTVRMALRLGSFISVFEFFVGQYMKFTEGSKFNRALITMLGELASKSKMLQTLLTAMSGFFDNWYYFGRIGVYDFRSPQQNLTISRLGTTPTIISYVMDIINEVKD
jgi:hypothetical protein